MRKLTRFIAAAILLSGLAAASSAEARVLYTVNGMPASPAVTRYMASHGLAPGHYWLNARGYWGVVGNPIPFGNIHAARGGGGAARPGLSQRGMLYRPGEIINGR